MSASIVEKIYTEELNSVITDINTGTLSAYKAIAGVDCIDKRRNEDVLGAFKFYSKEKDKISEDLNKKGLESIAIIPTEIFSKIKNSKNYDFYEFRTLNKDNTLDSNIKNLVDNYNNDGMSVLILCITTFLIGIPLLSTGFFTSVWTYIGWCLLGFFARVGFVLLSLSSPYLNYLGWITSTEYFLSTELYKSYMIRNIKTYLWPDKRDTKLVISSYIRGEDYKKELVDNTKVKIKLHPAPLETQKRLLKWMDAGFMPYLVCDSRSFEVLFEGEFKKNIEKASRLSAKIDSDPMVCLEINNHTIIIDQYGPFVHEQEIVNYVREYFSDIKKKENLY